MSARLNGCLSAWLTGCLRVQAGLRKTLYDEHLSHTKVRIRVRSNPHPPPNLSHTKETDECVPYRSGDFFYYGRTVKGLSYGVRWLVLGLGIALVTARGPSRDCLTGSERLRGLRLGFKV